MVPALNEGKNIGPTIETVRSIVKPRVDAYEIIVVNDGSTDDTGAVADAAAADDPLVTVVHHPTPRGLGYAYKVGLARAKHANYVYVPGDNELPPQALTSLVDRLGDADIVIHFVTNMEVRTPARRVVSVTYTTLMNTLFGLDLKYFNGAVIHRTELLRGLGGWTDSFAYQTEILLRLLRDGATYVEVGCEMVPRTSGTSAAFRPKNVVGVATAIGRLFWQLRVRGGRPRR